MTKAEKHRDPWFFPDPRPSRQAALIWPWWASEYNPRLKGEEAEAARARAPRIPNMPEILQPCCDNEKRGWSGGCMNCGDPCL